MAAGLRPPGSLGVRVLNAFNMAVAELHKDNLQKGCGSCSCTDAALCPQVTLEQPLQGQCKRVLYPSSVGLPSDARRSQGQTAFATACYQSCSASRVGGLGSGCVLEEAVQRVCKVL